MSMKKKALSGVKWTSMSSMILAVIQLTQLAVLTRYLDITDFGLMAIVGVIGGIFVIGSLLPDLLPAGLFSHERAPKNGGVVGVRGKGRTDGRLTAKIF